ncbi:MAG: hypothetical protein AAB969_01705, partial [Patescibacteria group bacterium]
AIIGIFSSLTVINFRGNEKVRDMDNQSRLLLDGIKRMQTSSLSGKVVSGQVPIAYVFEINKCSSNNCTYILKAKTAPDVYIITDTVSLDKSIVDITSNKIVIEITPPRSDIKFYLDGLPTAEPDIIISLKHKDDQSVIKNIRINRISGRMDILSQ